MLHAEDWSGPNGLRERLAQRRFVGEHLLTVAEDLVRKVTTRPSGTKP